MGSERDVRKGAPGHFAVPDLTRRYERRHQLRRDTS